MNQNKLNMKQIVLFSFLSLLGMTQAVAQDGWEEWLSDYLPIVREGVKWVNEKVIVNHGDTTCYYYMYEFSGYDTLTNLPGQINNACYYYTGENLNAEQDSLIAGLRDGLGEVTFFRNHAYAKMRSEGKALIDLPMRLDGGTTTIYDFRPLFDNECIGFFLWCQEFSEVEPFLSEDNFIRIEPITIDGYNCSRYVYLDEQGNPLACIVEGIGFDSYDMGDLLTPFTRKPDPDADYQEWCGLSHVVKDGKIIYKGMRWRDGVITGIDEVVAEPSRRPHDPNFYNLMGQPVGKDVPTTPGIYIHNGKKIIVR